jgi:hypothetical protein
MRRAAAQFEIADLENSFKNRLFLAIAALLRFSNLASIC